MSRTKKRSPGNGKKRKAEDDSTSTTQPPPKRAKEAKKPSSKDAALDTQTSINTAFAHMTPDFLSDHLAAQTKKFEEDLSLVELEERRIPKAVIRDTTTFAPHRTLEHMPDFMRTFSSPRRKSEDLSTAAKDPGTPHTLVVTGSGLRAADMTRALREFQSKDSTVAKLFAKHIKLDEAKKYVAKTRMGIGVGTPKRISDLLEDGVLKTTALERVVVDVSFIDLKKRGLLDMKELLTPLMDLLNRENLKERFGAESEEAVELIFY